MTTNGHPKLLLVESDGNDRRALTTLLSGCGYEVVSAVDYEGAKKQLDSSRPDVAVVSTQLEKGPSGFVVLREVLASGRVAVVLLPEEHHGEAVSAFRLGATDVLVKPPRASELIASLRRGLGQSPEFESSDAPNAEPAEAPAEAAEEVGGEA